MSTRRHFWNDSLLAGALAAAYALFAFTFRGPKSQFWQRMTRQGLLLGGIALVAEPSLRRTRIRARDVLAGIASAGVLYLVFQVGDRLARAILPGGGQDIDAIYALRRLEPKQQLVARLGLVIGPSEELFWHGFIQKRLIQNYGPLSGAFLATALYGGAHIASGNFTLFGAAAVAGAFWGFLSMLGVPPGALIASHIAWDIIIFLIAPTQKLQD